ncbi:MAG: hypothetical protein JO055_03990 [Alphaproteobacteria bacterium]|nr:hypothetical protein [Alphaproteobacteria bacterium]
MTSDFKSAVSAACMPAPASFRLLALAHIDRDTFHVSAILGFALMAASTLLLNYGSFARALAAFGLAPAH